MEHRRLLVVEDSDAKLASITAALRACLPLQIEVAKSVKSALKLLKGEEFALIIADMSLPTFDVKSRERGGTARPFGGIELFDYLQRRLDETPVVVVSSYPAIVDGGTSLTLTDLAQKLRITYPRIFAGHVFFDSAYLTWEIQLQALAKEIIDGKSTA
jgi:CheY-like chemotaxis protein